MTPDRVQVDPLTLRPGMRVRISIAVATGSGLAIAEVVRCWEVSAGRVAVRWRRLDGSELTRYYSGVRPHFVDLVLPEVLE